MGKVSNKTKEAVNCIEDIIQRIFNSIYDFKIYEKELVSLYDKCEKIELFEFLKEITSISSFQRNSYINSLKNINNEFNDAIKDEGIIFHKNRFKKKLFTQKRLDEIFNTLSYANDITNDINNELIILEGLYDEDINTYKRKIKIIQYRKENIDIVVDLATSLLKITDYFNIFIDV